VRMVLPFLQAAGLVPDPPPEHVARQVSAIVQAGGDRLKIAGDILDFADFFLPDDQLPYDAGAFEKRLAKPPRAAELLRKFQARLAAFEAFDAPALESLLQQFIEAEGIKVGDVIHAVRVAVTGKAVGFGMFETLEILGRERCLARIERALSRLKSAVGGAAVPETN